MLTKIAQYAHRAVFGFSTLMLVVEGIDVNVTLKPHKFTFSLPDRK
jgi:hypothetical protein